MATIRRRKHGERANRITAAALSAWRAGDSLALHRELRLPPWQASPLIAAGKCPWPSGAGASTWADSCALRAELEAAHGHD